MNRYINKKWKIRISKTYSEAKNHIIVGKVLDCNSTFICIESKTFHFGNVVNSLKEIREGKLDSRIIPWNRVEIIHKLPTGFLFNNAELEKTDDGVIFNDGEIACQIVRLMDKRY